MSDKPKLEDFYDESDPRGCSSTEYRQYEAALTAWEDAKIEKEQEEGTYSPYCKICTGCGESGCCSPVACEQHPDGAYCRGNLNELKFGYLMFEDLYELISKHGDKDLIDKAGELYDTNWDIIYDKQ